MMQTNFTPDQLQDPKLAEANAILRACVHCGFCTATCPTYQVLGDELDSPRGRIYLIKDMLEQGRPADAKTVQHIDRCLGCLACTTTCPSGVDYMHLLDQARGHIEATYRRPLMDRVLRATLARILPYPARFRAALGLARLARPFARLIPDARLRAMLDLAPKSLPARQTLTAPQVTAPKMRVALMTGCAQKVLDPEINAATVRLLTRLGAQVVIPEQGCCGALTHHMGRDATGFARTNIDAFLAAGQIDAIVINTSGCGTTVKDYGHLLGTDDARTIAAKAMDISEALAKLDMPAGNMGLTVAYHAACSLQHGQQIKSLPKELLKRAGFRVVEPADSHLCCGSAGTYNLLHPEISKQLRDRKRATLAATGADIIATGNIGCMMQIGGPVVHMVQLLDWATGGPKPFILKASGRGN
jgi:glycolate oxidase iron-sulfur subunit